MQWSLDILVIVLLVATLLQAARLQRTLSVLKRDHGPLHSLVGQFDASTREAQVGIERLREAADGAGRGLARQTQQAGSLSQDLAFLIERGETLADRLEQLLRAANRPAEAASLPIPTAPPRPPKPSPQTWSPSGAASLGALPTVRPPADSPPESRTRSRAEQDLLAALRMTR